MPGLTFLGKSILAAIVLVLVGVGALYFWATTGRAPGPLACTADAMQCPGGTWVGRTGPNCEFVCPAATTTAATTTTGGGGGFAEYHSGIRGTVMAGPTCPVERNPPDPNCADRPLQTTVSISRAIDKTHVIATVPSDTQGAFQVSLPPGEYTVSASTGTMLPRCNPTDAIVGPTGYSVVAISCDTGIR